MKTILFSFMLLIALLNPALAGAALLGEQEVDFKNDHDRIDVKRSAGPLRQLRIEVRNAPIEFATWWSRLPTAKLSNQK